MTLKYIYVGEETPVERLRNKLQPLFFIVEHLKGGGNLDDFPEVLEAANDSLEDIRHHLSDTKPFYTTQAIKEYKTTLTQYPITPDDEFIIGDYEDDSDEK
jgi:hypothetical protein